MRYLKPALVVLALASAGFFALRHRSSSGCPVTPDCPCDAER